MRRGLLGIALAVAFAIGAKAGPGQSSFCILGVGGSAGACPTPLQFDLSGSVSPKELPKRSIVPVTLRVRGEVSAGKGKNPPALRMATVDIDRNVVIEARGLPVCSFRQLSKNDAATARRLCGSSLVGTGVAHIGSSQEAPIQATLGFFNAGHSHGVTALLIQATLGSRSSAPIVAAIKVSKTAQGRYGWQAVLKVPPILEGDGVVLDFAFKVNRRFEANGRQKSYLAARCPDGRLQSKVETIFARPAGAAIRDTTKMSGTLTRPCMIEG